MDQTTPSLQEIQDKIRAAATAAGINPDTALRIANAESVFSNTAKNTRSSARGLFQVIDQTWKDLGGDPKLRNDLDENIRIGIKAISNNRDAFLKKYGTEPDTKQLYGMHFLGPSQAIRVFNSAEDAAIKNIVPKKVIKANPFLDKMSVADFISFTQKKMDKKSPVAPSTTAIAKTETAPVPMPQAPRETMQQTPTKAPATKEVASVPMNRNMLDELGANYQAALGAIALADSAEDDEADELLMEKYAERFGDQTVDVPITSALSNVQLTYASPFEEPAPVQMSKGGDPSIPFPMDLSIDEIPEMPPNPTPEQEAEFFRKVEEMDANAYWKRRGPNSADELNYSPSRKMLDEFKSNMPTGDKEVGVQKMAFGGIPYKPSALIPSRVKNQVSSAQSALDAYNNEVNSYNDRMNAYTQQVEDYNNQINAYNDQLNQYKSSYIGGDNPVVFIKGKGGTYQAAIGKAGSLKQNTPNINVSEYGRIPQLGNVQGYYIRQGDYRDVSQPGNAPGNAPTAPNAPTQPTQTIESAQAAVAAAKDKQRRLQLTYDVMEDPERFNLSMPALFAEGGEAEKSTSAKLFEAYRKYTADSPLLNWEAFYKALTPVQLRTFLETTAMPEGTRKDRPVTEKNFSESELRQLLDTIGTARKNRAKEKGFNSTYTPTSKDNHYMSIDKLFEKTMGKEAKARTEAEKKHFESGSGSVNYMDYPGFLSGGDSTLSKEGAIRNTLGRFVYETLPDGRIRVKDTYDFKNDLQELGQRPSAAYKGMSDIEKMGTIVVDTLNNPMDLQSEAGGIRIGRATLPSRMGSAFIGEKGRPVDITLDPRELMPGYAGYAQGGPVYRANGSPIYGEIPDSGGITPDTRAALTNYEDFKNFSPREAFNMLMGIRSEANANAESLMRGSASATLGAAGDIGQEFDIRGLRNLPSSKQLRAMFPQRYTQPTKEDEGFTNVGEFVPFVSPSFVKSTAQTMMNAFKKTAPTGPTTDQLSRALFGNSTTVQSRVAEDTLRDMQRLNNHLDGARVSSPVVQAVTPAARSADQLFVGRVDEFLANQKNPVTKEQLIGQLKGKFRDYEIARVEEALADLPATSKLQPADLLARVKSKYPVDNFRTSIIEPKPGVVYSNVDNVYGGDIGVINLSLPVADVARKASDDAMLTLNSLNNFGKGRFNPPQIAQITNYLKEKGLSSNYKELLNSLKVVENSPEIKKLTTAKETLLDVGRAVMYPSLHAKEAEVFAKLRKQYPNKSVGELLPLRDMEMARIGLKQLTDLASDPQFKTLQPIASALKRGIDSGQEVRTSDIIGKINVEVSLLDEQFKPAIDTLVSGAAKDEYTKLGKELQKKRIYEGQHNSITAKENPIAFSRFVDKEAIIPGMGKTKTMHIVELQSDLFDDIIKKGPKAGSKEKDLAEVADLDKKAFQIEHSGPFQKEAVDKLKTISYTFYPSPAEKSEAYKEILGRYPDLKTQLLDYMKLTDRSTKLRARAEIGNYNMDEAFAGMEKSPQVLQQLMIKNSIGAAMQRGVNAITFPGKESQQSQLYEKLGPNLKQVVKDLGKGFEIRSIELYDDFGQPYMHQGLVWSKEAAARLLKEGIKFNQGGAVDKNNLDYAKYI
jgi:hypothetical protein